MKGKFINGYLMDNKHVSGWISLFAIVILLNQCLTLALSNSERKNWVILKVKPADKQFLMTQLKRQNLTLLYQITPVTCILEGTKNAQDVLQSVLKAFHDKILDAEVVRIYEATLKPWEVVDDRSTVARTVTDLNDDHYGRDITNVWSRGYTGKGVTIAVTGVGIETQLLDLKRNIDPSLSFNFVSNNFDVTPEKLTSAQETASEFTNHGNRITSIIAAEDNTICSTGISYDSTIVGIKLFSLRTIAGSQPGAIPIHWTASDIVARALVHRLDDIDIFVNAWTSTLPFDHLDLATREAITYGARKGRHGLGSIHVVPAGPVGSWFSNNIYTITVGMLGVNGTIPSGAVLDASVLTSGLGEGSNLTSTYWVTSSRNNACDTRFRGYSAALGYVGGIIALGLQANPNLTLRDVQHLLVLASDHSVLQDGSAFQQNAAGLYYHEKLGFGFLNAEKFVSLALTRKQALPLLSVTLSSSEIREVDSSTKKYEFCYTCDVAKDTNCLTTIEHAVVSVDFNTPLAMATVEIVSPSGTSSLVMDFEGETRTRRKAEFVSVNFWNEMAFGIWIIILHTTRSSDSAHIDLTALTLHGTQNNTLIRDKHMLKVTKGCDKPYHLQLVSESPNVANASETTTKGAKSDEGHTLNIPLLVILPIGVLITCGIMVYILMRGHNHGPISSFGVPKKKTTARRRQRHDSPLHRQISLLRQKSRQDSTSEDIEGEADAE